MSKKLTYADVLTFPKIDLHRHLDGSVSPELVIELAREFGVNLPTYDIDEFKKLYRITPEMSVNEFLERFAWTIAVMRNPEGLERVAYEQVLALARENIWYAELRFAPNYHGFYYPLYYNLEKYEKKPFRIFSMQEIIESVLRGIKKGREETGVITNLILCIPRECAEHFGIACKFEIAFLALTYQYRGVVALDLACDEYKYPPELYTDVFQWAHKNGIKCDPHAGEMGTSEDEKLKNIETCIIDLRADGLGHAIPLYKSKKLMETVKAKRIRIERNPFNFVGPTNISGDTEKFVDGSGIDVLLKNEILVSICSDDPALMGKSLTDNLFAVLDYYNWGEKELMQLTENALSGAFFMNGDEEEEVRKTLVKKIVG